MKAFEPGYIGKIQIKNRFVHSPTYEKLADPDGLCTPELLAFNRTLASGGIGLNEVSFAVVHPSGRHLPRQIGIYHDGMIPGLSALAAVHREAGCRAFIQLAHAGPHGKQELSGFPAMGPSEMENRKGGRCQAMTKMQIEDAAGWYARAAARAREAGFDGVTLHAAHGYLIGAFLSPYYNKRQDEYGGSAENRARFFLEVLAAVRSEVGRDYPVATKMNSEDGIPGGMEVGLMLQYAKLLEANGIDAIELSYGVNADGGPSEVSSPKTNPRSPEEEGYFLAADKRCRETVNVPVIAVGGFRSPEGCERALQMGAADFIALSRPLVREPDLVGRWVQGDERRAKCISCNLCRRELMQGDMPHLMCVLEKRMEGRT